VLVVLETSSRNIAKFRKIFSNQLYQLNKPKVLAGGPWHCINSLQMAYHPEMVDSTIVLHHIWLKIPHYVIDVTHLTGMVSKKY
jgi:hypothetical protein